MCLVNLYSFRGFVEPLAQYALLVFLMPPLRKLEAAATRIGVESLSSASQCCHAVPHRLAVRF